MDDGWLADQIDVVLATASMQVQRLMLLPTTS